MSATWGNFHQRWTLRCEAVLKAHHRCVGAAVAPDQLAHFCHRRASHGYENDLGLRERVGIGCEVEVGAGNSLVEARVIRKPEPLRANLVKDSLAENQRYLPARQGQGATQEVAVTFRSGDCDLVPIVVHGLR